MIIGTPESMDINLLESCPNNRQDLFVFYKRKGLTMDKFEIIIDYIERYKKCVYYYPNYFAFYNEEGKLLAGEGPDWGD